MRQGRHPWLRWVRWGLFACLIALVIGANAGTAFDAASSWLRDEYERLPWYATRITALLAYLALTGSTIYGLLLSTKIIDPVSHRAISVTLHQDLAGIGISLALVHAAVLMIDRSVPYSPLELVIPFAGPYRPLWVGVGQLALVLGLAVLLSFYARKQLGARAWRRIHYLSFVAFVGATAHGIMAGSDSGAPWVGAGYVVMVAIVVFLIVYRLVLALPAGADDRGEKALPVSTARSSSATAPSAPSASATTPTSHPASGIAPPPARPVRGPVPPRVQTPPARAG